MKINISKTGYQSKPQKQQIAQIQTEIAENTENMTVLELAEALTSGRSFKPGFLNGGRKAEDWKEQQVFALDFDGDSDKKFTIFNAIGRCAIYNIYPAFCYRTFSDQDNCNFRMVFVNEQPITDIRVRNVIQMGLMTLFPESDKSCKDCSRLFFGTNKEQMFTQYEKRIDPMNLILSMLNYLKATDKNNNFNRIVKNYCSTVGLNMKNNYPCIYEENNDENDVNVASSIYIYRVCRKNVKNNIIFDFNIEEFEATKIIVAGEGKKTIKKVKIENNKSNNKKDEIRNFDFDHLEENCQLWNDLKGGEYVHHQQHFGICTNMWRVKGAEKQIIEAVENCSEMSQDKKNNKINTLVYTKKMGYSPMRCDDFCPYSNECNHYKNMLQQTELKRNNIRQIEAVAEKKELFIAESELEDAIEDAIEAKNNDVYVIKAPTGIGKTTALARLNNYNNTLIAYPNHRLGTDIIERLNIPNALHLSKLELNNKNILAEYETLTSKGAFQKAYSILEKYKNDMIIQTSGNTEAREQVIQEIEAINSFMEQQKEAKNTSKLIYCTHQKMINLKNKNIETYIIDEDILISSLMQTIEVNLTDLHFIKTLAQSNNFTATTGIFNDLIDQAEEALEKTNTVIKTSNKIINSKEIKELINDNVDKLDVNVMDLARIRAFSSNDKGQILGIVKNELPKQKCIILSATANQQIYTRFFKDRKVNFIDLGNVEKEGKLIIHYTSCSRTSLNSKFDKIVEQVKKEAKDIKNMITFAKFESKFQKEGFDTIAHFGATTGLDGYKGQDLVVVGTPHIDNRVYSLFATVLGEDFIISDEIVYQKVKRNGFEFYFNTYETSDFMQEIQFYLIETELIQAIGRARILRTDATVHLFSNLPLAGAEIYSKY